MDSDRCLQDVLIVGGGLIGASLALGLARAGYSVSLFDAKSPQLNAGASGHDPRTVAISPHTQQLLNNLDVWKGLSSQAYNRMLVWEEQGTAQMEFKASEVDRENLGWIVELSPALVHLWQMLKQEPNVQLNVGGRVTAVEVDPQGATLQFGDDKQEYKGRLLLAADGARSSIASLLNISGSQTDTGHEAIASIVKVARPHSGTAFQRFLLDGPVALLPIVDKEAGAHYLSLVWSQSPGQAKRRMQLDDGAFCQELECATESCLGAILSVDQRFCFPLQQTLRSNFYPNSRVLFVGDAAHVLHPLAGQGVNVGFEGVKELLEIAGEGRPDLGQTDLWSGYARRRRLRARTMQSVMAGFQHVYQQDEPLLQWIRNMGVHVLNHNLSAKKQIMREALGLGTFT